MRHTKVSLLIVDDDTELVRLLTRVAEDQGYHAVGAISVVEAEAAMRSAAFDVAIVDLALGSESGFDVIRRVREQAPDTEIIVLSGTTSLATAIQSYELAAFAFVQKPFDLGQLFATVERALERRRMNLDNRRMLWELQTINEIADGIGRSLELNDILTGALQCVVRALSVYGGAIRLRDPFTDAFEVHATVGPVPLHRIWTDLVKAPRPSDQVITTRAAVVVEDLRALVPPDVAGRLPIRSALGVPIAAGDELLGTLTVGAVTPGRFTLADQRLLATVGGQIAVAIHNARLHDSVRRGKREWEQTFDAIADPIAVFDSKGELRRGNAALAAHLGRAVTGLRGATCDEVGFCDGSADCAVSRALGNQGGRAELTRPDGQIFSVTTFPVAGGNDGASVVQVAKNVTEEIRSARRLQQMSDELALANGRSMAALERLKSTQAQLVQAEKLSAIGQLVAGVAHELNNPLTSVIGYAQLLEEEFRHEDGEVRSGDQIARDLRRIAEESERAAKIVRNLLAFARRQTAERSPQDVAELCSRVLSLRGYEMRLNGIELETALESQLPRVLADGGQIQQALLNLVLNAEQAMRNRVARRLRVGARFDSTAGAVELTVRDTGHGIEHANLSRIFDPFFTTRDVGEGTGLGLSICYGIVRDHGGQISVESKVDVGTTFTLLLPAQLEGDKGGTVLIAHADQTDRDFIASAFAAWGYRVVTALTATEALSTLREREILAACVDRATLASDLAGFRAARAAAPATPLIVMSMGTDDGEVEQFGREQASASLVPPFQLRAIRSAVQAVIKEYV